MIIIAKGMVRSVLLYVSYVFLQKKINIIYDCDKHRGIVIFSFLSKEIILLLLLLLLSAKDVDKCNHG